MSKMIRLAVAVAADKLADVIDMITADGGSVQIGGSVDTSDDTTVADDSEIDRKVRRANSGNGASASAARTAARPAAKRQRLAGKVIYTPAGTKRQIDTLLADLRGQQTMRAFVLRDLAKHPGSSNREVRERIETAAKRAGLSVESVDNVIWQLVNKGQINKRAEA